MNSRAVHMSGMSLMGVAVGLAAGMAAGLLMAPMRGTDMRTSLRSRADEALDRGMTLFEEGRRAFARGGHGEQTGDSNSDALAPSGSRARVAAAPSALTATLSEIAEMHPGTKNPIEAQS